MAMDDVQNNNLSEDQPLKETITTAKQAQRQAVEGTVKPSRTVNVIQVGEKDFRDLSPRFKQFKYIRSKPRHQNTFKSSRKLSQVHPQLLVYSVAQLRLPFVICIWREALDVISIP